MSEHTHGAGINNPERDWTHGAGIDKTTHMSESHAVPSQRDRLPWGSPADVPVQADWMRRITFPTEHFRIIHIGILGITLGGTQPYLVTWEHMNEYEYATVRAGGGFWLGCTT